MKDLDEQKEIFREKICELEIIQKEGLIEINNMQGDCYLN